MSIDLLATFLYNPLQLVGFCRRKAPERTGKSRLALLFSDPTEPVDDVGSHFQLGWCQGLHSSTMLSRRLTTPRYNGMIALASNGRS